jgi:hypothetical protein
MKWGVGMDLFVYFTIVNIVVFIKKTWNIVPPVTKVQWFSSPQFHLVSKLPIKNTRRRSKNFKASG